MNRFLLFSVALTLTACGVQRPLIRPSEIPAYEEQQRKKKEAIEKELRELEAIDAQRAAEKAAADKAREPSE